MGVTTFGFVRIASLSVVMAISCAAGSEKPLAVFPITQESLAQLSKQHPLASAEVEDPVYKRKQKYEGIWLRDVLKDLSPAGHSEADVVVRFRCKDGYLPIMPLARAMRATGLVAIRDANAPPGEDWQKIVQNGASSTPAPSYLVWVAPPGGPEEYPWPYQMVAIELVSASETVSGLDPDASKPGHDLFVTHCLKCHAINGVGGTFGPELNSPCSVTEYWNPRLLSRFIANAPTVRAATRMPSFDSLPDKDIQAIIEYLHSVASQKKPGVACP